jgi:hypothetical protein
VYHESLKYDFYPCKDEKQIETELNDKIVLGKRDKPDQVIIPKPSSSFSESYIFNYLSLNKTPEEILKIYLTLNTTIDPSLDWMESYLSFKTS